jgi:hypothetical protein
MTIHARATCTSCRKRDAPGSASSPPSRPRPNPLHQVLALQRSAGNAVVERLLSGLAAGSASPPLIQRRPIVSSPGDAFERQADRTADEIMAMPTPCKCGGRCKACSKSRAGSSDATPPIQRSAATSASVSPRRATESSSFPSELPALPGPGRPLSAQARTFFEPRFHANFGNVRVHTGSAAEASARRLSARAYTQGSHIVFGAGHYAPTTDAGRHLLAHELAHVLQQDHRGAGLPWIQRARDDLVYQPSRNGEPCACLVFMHNNERAARWAAYMLHRECRYNLAMVAGPSTSREISIRGVGRRDPNELFPQNVLEECRRDWAACRRAAGRGSLAAVQRQYLVALHDCSNNFQLPVVALHNNVLSDTRRYQRARQRQIGSIALALVAGNMLEVIRRSLTLTDIPGDYFHTETNPAATGFTAHNIPAGSLTDEDLDRRLQRLERDTGINFRAQVNRGGMTNIFRWCRGRGLGRCHIGNPARPDDVIWTTDPQDFQTLSRQPVNVVLQTTIPDTDLSAMFLRLRNLVTTERQNLQAALRSVRAWQPRSWLAAIAKQVAETGLLALLANPEYATNRRFRFINIETPHARPGHFAGSEAIYAYETMTGVLEHLGLHCCPNIVGPPAYLNPGDLVDTNVLERRERQRRRQQ